MFDCSEIKLGVECLTAVRLRWLSIIVPMQWFVEHEDASQHSAAMVHTYTDPSSIHSIEFSVLKHRADLLYYQRQYREAVQLYGRILAAVPESNACVSREVRDAIARCHFKLGDGEQAREEAERMVRNHQTTIVFVNWYVYARFFHPMTKTGPHGSCCLSVTKFCRTMKVHHFGY